MSLKQKDRSSCVRRGEKRLSVILLVLVGGIALWFVLPGLQEALLPAGTEEATPPDVGVPAPQPTLISVGKESTVPDMGERTPHTARTVTAGVQGVVVDDATGEPIEGARVFAHCGEGLFVGAARAVLSDAKGSFALLERNACGDASDGWLVARAAGYEPKQRALAGAASLIEIRLARGVQISGVVETTWGQPIPGASVLARTPWNRIGWPATETEVASAVSPGAKTTTDARGAFTLAGLSEGVEYDLLASKDGYGQQGLSYERVEAPMAKVTLQLSLEARVVFVDPRNAARQGSAAVMKWMPTLVLPTHRVLNSVGCSYWKTGRVGEERFLVEGEARIGQEIELPYYVITHDRGMVAGTAIAKVGLTTVHELPGTDADVVPLWIQATYGDAKLFSGWLAIRLARVSGSGYSVMRVQLRAGRAVVPIKVKRGEYQLFGMSGGDVETAFWTPFTMKRVEVTGETEVDLHLVGVPCTLRVVDPSGALVQGFTIQVETPPGKPSGWFHSALSNNVDPSTYATPLWLGPGQHLISAAVPHLGRGSVNVRIKEQSGPIDIELVLDSKKQLDLWAETRKMRRR